MDEPEVLDDPDIEGDVSERPLVATSIRANESLAEWKIDTVYLRLGVLPPYYRPSVSMISLTETLPQADVMPSYKIQEAIELPWKELKNVEAS